MMKRLFRFSLVFVFSTLTLVACAKQTPTVQNLPSPIPSSTFTPIPPTETPTPSPTFTSTLVPTDTATPTQTPVPFTGFMNGFSLYRAWNDDGKTYFYFLQANFPGTLYAKADEYNLVCNPDPQYPIHIKCVADEKIFGKDEMTFSFYTDAERQDLVYTKNFYTGLVDDIVYYHANDCPDRGKNIHCESEYRLYDGRCYYAHTCFDACGLYYSRDNIPDVWTEFQGYTVPCN